MKKEKHSVKRHKWSVSWITDDEIKFVKSLSIEKIIKYIAALSLRQYWGDINKQELLNSLKTI